MGVWALAVRPYRTLGFPGLLSPRSWPRPPCYTTEDWPSQTLTSNNTSLNPHGEPTTQAGKPAVLIPPCALCRPLAAAK